MVHKETFFEIILRTIIFSWTLKSLKIEKSKQFEQKSKTASLLGKGTSVPDSLVPEAGKNEILDRYVVNRASWFSVTLPAAQTLITSNESWGIDATTPWNRAIGCNNEEFRIELSVPIPFKFLTIIKLS